MKTQKPSLRPGVSYLNLILFSPFLVLIAIKPELTFSISTFSLLTVAEKPSSNGTVKTKREFSIIWHLV